MPCAAMNLAEARHDSITSGRAQLHPCVRSCISRAKLSTWPIFGASIRYNCVHYHLFPLPLREQSVHCMSVQAMTQTQSPAFSAHLRFNLVGERTAGLLFERLSRSSLAKNTSYMGLQATRANARKQTCRYLTLQTGTQPVPRRRVICALTLDISCTTHAP
jgi:hypothetical protein